MAKSERGKEKQGYEQLRHVEPEVMKRFLDLLRIGNYLETAALCAGLKVHSVKFWMRKGQADDRKGRRNLHTDFYWSVRQAQSESEARDMALILKHGQDESGRNWTALAWRLERRFPEKYGRRSREEAEREKAPPAPKQKLELFDGKIVEF